MKASTPQSFGQHCEQRACEFYQGLGYTLLQRNYRCDVGEIDLIVKKDEQLVFVEVRARRSDKFMHPLESISPRKVQHIRRAAECYLLQQRTDYFCRFDIIAMTPKSPTADKMQIEHFIDAF